MKVKDLIRFLKVYNPESDIVIRDADTGWKLEIQEIIQINLDCPVELSSSYNKQYKKEK
jgi:hypothetical protein